MPGQTFNSREINTGEYGLIGFRTPQDSITTGNLGPCVAVVAYDGARGAMAHLWTDAATEADVAEFSRWLSANFKPGKTSIALVGGMDRPPGNYGFNSESIGSSQDMVRTIELELSRRGFSIDHRDLFGHHQRSVTLNANGTIEIYDAWQTGEGKYPASATLKPKDVRRAASLSATVCEGKGFP